MLGGDASHTGVAGDMGNEHRLIIQQKLTQPLVGPSIV